jgi:LmbE family N-acetylglucosaminyl deacetylase
VTATGPAAAASPPPEPDPATARTIDRPDDVALDVRDALDQKIAALVAHRSQYALDAELLPRRVLGPLLSTEHFTVIARD